MIKLIMAISIGLTGGSFLYNQLFPEPEISISFEGDWDELGHP